MFKSYLRGFILVYTGTHDFQLIEPGLHVSYAEPDGGPVLKTDIGWHNWNGFLYRLRRRTVWVYFRRRSHVWKYRPGGVIK